MAVEVVHAAGTGCLNLATTLLQRVRLSNPTAGIWEAADVQWWWRRPRPSDVLDQTFWVDDNGPVASALLTAFDASWQLDVIVVPEHRHSLLPVAWEDALTRVLQFGLGDVEVLARDDDDAMLKLLADADFSAGQDCSGSTWMCAADARPAHSAPEGYRWTDRSVRSGSPHWLASRNGPDVHTRLAECSLYDADLDMAMETLDGQIAGYALFWFDPVTSVGLIEPMRTEEAHQRRGVARALIGEGLDRLVARGAKRLKVGYSTDEARTLYLNSGFVPTDTHHAYRRK